MYSYSTLSKTAALLCCKLTGKETWTIAWMSCWRDMRHCKAFQVAKAHIWAASLLPWCLQGAWFERNAEKNWKDSFLSSDRIQDRLYPSFNKKKSHIKFCLLVYAYLKADLLIFLGFVSSIACVSYCTSVIKSFQLQDKRDNCTTL